jgi:hypothetical protein
MELVVTHDEDGVLELVNEMSIAPAPPERDSLTDRASVVLRHAFGRG